MAFSNKLKEEVKEKADFRCCRCRRIGIHVHHLIQEKDGGPDTFENAAPLCPRCHDNFGHDPKKRKEITHMRDRWYKIVQDKFPDNSTNIKELSKINSLLESQSIDLKELKTTLKHVSNNLIDSITNDTASVAASGIVNTSYSIFEEEDVYVNEKCPNCGSIVLSVLESNLCPNCKKPLN